MKYDIVLVDLDNTLLDFLAASYAALLKTFHHFGYEFAERERDIFFAINEGMWKEFEVGKIQKSEIYPGRFRRYLERQGLQGDPEALNAFYMPHLREGHQLMPHALELMETLKRMGCILGAATNGETESQYKRLAESGLLPFFDHLFISEELGANKPTAAYFDRVFAILGEDARSRAIILGDSLTSDMQGGRNAGIATCFIGDPAEADDRCDYIITDLMDFPAILL